MSVLRHKVLSEEHDRQRLEETFIKKDDQIGKLKTTFDRSLNTISGDARNLQTILDKSLYKLDKHIMATKGVILTDSDVTSNDEYSPSKAPTKRSDVATKLDKYELPVEHGLKTAKSSKNQDGKLDLHKKGKNSNLNSKGRLNEYTPTRAKIVPTTSVKRPQRPDRK